MTNPGQGLPALDGFQYQAQRFIDTGSKMSEVLLALDGRGRPVVLKIASVEQRARAEVNRQAITNSIKWLQRLGSHPGLISLRPIDVAKPAGGRPRFAPPTYCATLEQWPDQPEFMVMEFLAGGSLRDFVHNRRLSIELSLWIAYHIAQSLAYVHGAGCVHRDLKPENILFRTTPGSKTNPHEAIPVLIDFGVAAQTGEAKLVSGSRLWMAPELQAAFEKRPLAVDPAWDVYALGLILCYMLTGRRPRYKSFDQASYERFAEGAYEVIDSEFDSASSRTLGINTALKQLIERSLAKDPTKRPSSAEFASEAAALLTRLGSSLSWRERLTKRLGHHTWLTSTPHLKPWAMAGSLLVLLVILVGLVAQQPLPLFNWRGWAAERTVFAADEAPANLAVASRQADVALTPTRRATAVATGATPTAFPPPAPTLIAVAPTLAMPTPATPAPTLAVWPGLATQPAPTLALTPPNLSSAPTLAATATSVRPGRVELIGPAAGVESQQASVVFSWRISGQPLAVDHCFDLVFWDPHYAIVKRAPLEASQAAQGRVRFADLANSQDLLLRRLARTHTPFNWGVRLVSCTSPAVVLREVEEVRSYTYAAP